jgi:hypothetical protein
MKLSEFIMLPQEEKRSAVLQEGVPVAQRKWLNYMVFLFQLPDFYVETFCCRESKEVREYRVFHNPEHLRPYLQTISIDI